MKPENDLPQGATGGGRLSNVAKQIHMEISQDSQNFVSPNTVKTVAIDKLDYENGMINLANAATPQHQTTTEIFSSRYLPTTVSKNYLITTPTIIDGKITDQNTAQIWFEVLPHQTYEIYKNDILQAVINNKTGIYTHNDKNMQQYNSYQVIASLNGEQKQASNQITLCSSTQKQMSSFNNAAPNKRVPWFF